jgi:hypothetical protein
VAWNRLHEMHLVAVLEQPLSMHTTTNIKDTEMAARQMPPNDLLGPEQFDFVQTRPDAVVLIPIIGVVPQNVGVQLGIAHDSESRHHSPPTHIRK